MKLPNFRAWKQLSIAGCSVAMGVAVAGLGIDYVSSTSTFEEMANQLRTVEAAARESTEATTKFESEVSRQTNASLARARRQRTAGITLLIAGGLGIALMKWQREAPVVVPPTNYQRSTTSPAPPLEEHANVQSSGHHKLPDVELTQVATIVEQLGTAPSQLLPLLLAIDEHYHYLPPAALRRLAELTGIARTQIAEVVSFYTQFRTTPRGKHVVQVCCGTACHVAGGDRILDEIRRLLHIPDGCDTDDEGNATVEVVGCLGCCTLAPVLRMDRQIIGRAEVQSLPTAVDRMLHPADRTNGEVPIELAAPYLKRNGHSLEIRVGVGSCCVAGGSQEVLDTLRQEIGRRGLQAMIKPVGCVGICHLTPLIEVVGTGTEPIMATHVTPADVRRIVQSLPDNSSWPQRMLNRITDISSRWDLAAHTALPCIVQLANVEGVRWFLDPQVRIVTEHSGSMSPTSLEEYRARDGFVALKVALRDCQAEEIIAAVERSGLRGRGGAGYPTYLKWRKMRESAGTKYVICNGDEGDPGAFMDRMIMESYPYRVLEGLAIAAYAVGANRAYVYVRHEYPLAVERLKNAIEQMTAAGLLGERIADTNFSLCIDIVEGGGAFVCGEETALLESIMGRRGTPQIRPPYPVERGLFGHPTLINNVETLANIPWIVRNGAERFATLGTPTSKGTKVFSLAGKVCRGGLIEIPLGMSIRQVIERIGGGVTEGKRFKAVQIGGPSGGCVPAELGDTPIDYESLRQVGAIMGSGGLIVLNDDDCMVDLARYFLEFTQRESCGHCTFCRVGTRKLLALLERLCAGKGRKSDLAEIEALSKSIAAGSMCGLGKTAPNPVLTTLKYFRDEYEAHLAGRCPAGRCKALIRYEVSRNCVGCTVCAQRCPVGAIQPTPYRQHWIDPQVCTRCDVCRACCPERAIQVI